MSTAQKLSGIVVPMLSPFRQDGALDDEAAARLTDHLAGAGVGAFVLGTTGEASSMDHASRRRLVAAAVRAAAGRVPVYAGIGDNCAAASVEAAREYLGLGAAAVVAHLPSYYLLDEAEMYSYFEYLSAGIGRDLIIYNMPQTTRMSLPVELLRRLAELPGVTGVKDSENTPGRPEAVAAALCGRPDFSVFMGVASLSTRALRLGFDGLVPSSGNLVPGLWESLRGAAAGARWDEVEALQGRVDAVAQVFQRNRSLAQSLAALKACAASLGLCCPHVLPPLRDADAETCARLGAELRALLG